MPCIVCYCSPSCHAWVSTGVQRSSDGQKPDDSWQLGMTTKTGIRNQIWPDFLASPTGRCSDGWRDLSPRGGRYDGFANVWCSIYAWIQTWISWCVWAWVLFLIECFQNVTSFISWFLVWCVKYRFNSSICSDLQGVVAHWVWFLFFSRFQIQFFLFLVSCSFSMFQIQFVCVSALCSFSIWLDFECFEQLRCEASSHKFIKSLRKVVTRKSWTAETEHCSTEEHGMP